MGRGQDIFRRLILPGFAFKALVIGGGYATGRELAEFFMPHGPWGGLVGMVAAAMVWSAVCAMTFLLARATGSHDYRSFFSVLLGRFWPLFELGYFALLILMLSVFGAAAGEIVAALLGGPRLAGTIGLMLGIGLFAGLGNRAVEGLFKYVSFFLYGVYALFLLLALGAFGDRIPQGFATAPVSFGGLFDGMSYAAYNIVAAVAILPVVRHMRDRRDALIAGLLCGPLAMAPAILFFTCMAAFYPAIAGETLPSDFLLARLDQRAFHILFQLMILAALLESGTGGVHAVNERIVAGFAARAAPVPRWLRPAVAFALLVASIFIADAVGLVALIGRGYRGLGIFFLLIYVLPVLTVGLWQLRRRHRPAQAVPA